MATPVAQIFQPGRQDLHQLTELRDLTQRITQEQWQLGNHDFLKPQIYQLPPPQPLFTITPITQRQITQPQPILPIQLEMDYQTLILECPFAWKTESYYLSRPTPLLPGNNPSISFTATKLSKVLGYLPIIGTIVGLYKIYKGVQEYRQFNQSHFHILSRRSIKWIVRGVMELPPILGGIICIITDIAATLLTRQAPNKPTQFPDETPCGFCHTCGVCKC